MEGEGDIVMLTEVVVPSKKIAEYKSYIPKVVAKLQKLSKAFVGLKIVHVNATAVGGGVAEMLQSQIPLERDLGFDSKWYVIPPQDKFFEITKAIHNFLQGKKGELTKKEKNLYVSYNRYIAALLDGVECDVLIIHDPQPAAALTFMKNRPRLCFWRCHIDTSSPNKKMWKFMLAYIKAYGGLIFTMPEFVNTGLEEYEIAFIPPSLDPFSPKNKGMSLQKADDIIASFGINPKFPLMTQVSRLDPWKDPLGVLSVFKKLTKDFPHLQLAFVAQMASDDPEGIIVAQEVQSKAHGIPHIFFIMNAPDNDKVVNAFQAASDVILQKSIKEGFALTVTEAMWKGNVVVGGKVGGIKLQIKDGVSGYLVNTIPETVQKIRKALKSPDLKFRIGKNAHESVLKHYLLPHLLVKQIKFIKKLF